MQAHEGLVVSVNSGNLLSQNSFKGQKIDVPVEGKNVQFRILNYEIDFFLKGKVFLEFHPPLRVGTKNETEGSYFTQRRKILDDNGFAGYPLIVIPHIEQAEEIIKEIKDNYFQ